MLSNSNILKWQKFPKYALLRFFENNVIQQQQTFSNWQNLPIKVFVSIFEATWHQKKCYATNILKLRKSPYLSICIDFLGHWHKKMLCNKQSQNDRNSLVIVFLHICRTNCFLKIIETKDWKCTKKSIKFETALVC